MTPGLKTVRFPLLILALASFALFGCNKLAPRSVMTANQPPEITLDAPSFGSGAHFTWRAHDPDGRIDHYVYALNPRSVDRVDPTWVRTDQMTAVVQFPRAAALGRAVLPGEEESGPRVFAVRAIDDRGAESAPAFLAVADSNQLAPDVIIDSPAPNPVFSPIVPTTVEISWHGRDLDGRVDKYKFKLFGPNDPFIDVILANPDTLRALYAPDFTGWEEVNANVTSKTYSGLAEQTLYLFALIAIDDDGNYTPVFSAFTNLLKFGVTDFLGGPQFCVQSSFFNFCNSLNGDLDLSYEIPVGALPITWFAIPQQGGQLTGYRWTLDPRDTTDLSGDNKGPNHWTTWSLSNTSTTVGPFSVGSLHVLYVQARDNVGFISTLRLRLTTIGTTPTRQLLVVDDTRLTPDQFDVGTGTYRPPLGPWPTAAELDTFLYARGGNPWRGYPAGTLSSPGLLNGYDFDTVGTRGNVSGIVPLSLLSQYRQVIWMTDDVGATYTGSPSELLAPITSLRLMSSPGQMNTLAAYGAQGGKLWLMGGGAAYSTLIAWGKRNTPSDDWTNADGELVTGRFMYDLTHWRSSVAVRPARQALINTPDWSPWPNAAPGRGWSGHGIDHSLSQPDYGKLAAIQVLSPRTCSTDPPPPQRFCNSFYLAASYTAEYIGRAASNSSPPNFIQEDVDPRSNQEQLESTLDTLYTAVGGSMPGQLPVMTYYHGFESGPVVFSGFPVWYFQRAQCQQLVDFVLHDIWGLTKTPGTATAAVATRRRSP